MNVDSVYFFYLLFFSRDSLIISVADAKISIVEWDLMTWDLKLVSLHFYENEERLKVYLFILARDNQVFQKNKLFLCVKTRGKFIVFEKLDCNLLYNTNIT
jgi:hypothetical protein